MRFLKLLILLFSIMSFCIFSQVARHKKLYVVPAPGKVNIDGKLDDWDLSGQILIYVIPETREVQSAKFAAMYDKEALYLSAIVKDTTPMMNRHDPYVEPDKGWDADSCQFRIVLDFSFGYPVNSSSWQPKMIDKLLHFTLWYYTDRKEPVLQIYKTMKYLPIREEWKGGVVPKDKFSAVYLKGENEYTFEYKIPWDTLGVKEVPVGKVLAGVVQFCWSAPDGLKTAGGSAWAYDVMSGPGFPYQSTLCWGKIIFSDEGNIPKEMVEEMIKPEKPLPLTFTYYLPEDGEVTIQLFDRNGYHVKTICASVRRNSGKNIERWDGLDENGNPLKPGEYIWKGLYHKGLKTKFLFSVHNSGDPPYKTDDNKGGWGGDHGVPTDVCKVPRGMLLAWDVCESGWGIIRVDLNGKKLWGIKSGATYLASDGKRFFASGDFGFEKYRGVRIYDASNGKVLNFENNEPIAELPIEEEEKYNVSGIFYKDGFLYISYRDLNLVAVNDAKTGKLIKKIEIENPGRLVVDDNSSIFVISGDRVVKIKNNGQREIFIKKYIEKPAGIAIDRKGNIYVANRGKLMNITIFNRNGKYIRSIGRKGGRPKIGRYRKDGILYPGGIDIDEKGRLWVAENCDAPKRISVWDTKTGKLINEFFGASAYSTWSYIDPERPDEIYCHNVIWKVDWEKLTYYPYSTIWRATEVNMVNGPSPGSYAGRFRVITAKNGKQYGWGASEYGNKLYMRVGDIFKPISGVIRLVRPPGYAPTGSNYKVLWDNPEKYPDGMYFWQDKNDNQKVEEDEVIRLRQEESNIFNWFDKDLNAWCDSGFILKPVKFEKDGKPVYDLSKKIPVPFRGTNSGFTSLVLSPDEKTIITLNPGQRLGFACYNRNWNLKWAYTNIIPWHQAISLPVVKPGRIWGLTMPLGITDGFTGAASYFGPFHIFTTDGIYVGMVMKDGRIPGLGSDINACENFTGQLVKIKGRYILLNGDQDGRVTEIIGLENVKRLPGGISNIKEEDYERVKEEHQKYQQLLAKSQKVHITRGKESLKVTEGVRKVGDETREFSVKVAYDDENIYFLYDVKSPFELVNSITDYRIIFKGGNLIDIQIATDRNAPEGRERPTFGDIRILVTRQEGKPVAVIYRPKVKNFKGKPIVLSSPTGKEEFDVIEKIENVNLEYKKTDYGFTALLALPLKLIGLEIKPGQEILMDVGYIFGNSKGSQVSLRSYLFNNSFSANVIYDIPNESRLEPKYWGKAIFE